MGSGDMIYVPNFMKIFKDVEGNLFLSILKGCEFGITDERKL
jgi:hypothetical protein